jgi:hypothetical protein
MFGYGRNSGIHWLRDYGDALHKYESTTDIRGRTEEPKRPLGHRRSTSQYSIRKEDDGTIACVLYRSPVVRFKPDGDIILRDFSYPTISTCYFMEEVLGGRVRTQLFNHSICITVGTTVSRMATDTDLVLRKNGEGNLYIVNPSRETTHHIVRGMPNKVRKQFDEFAKYAEGMLKVRDNGTFLAQEYDDMFTKLTDEERLKVNRLYKDMPSCLDRPDYVGFAESIKQFVDLAKDTSVDKHVSHYKALLTMAHSFGAVSWGSNYGVVGYRISMGSIEHGLRAIAMGIDRDKVFKTIEVPEGQIVRDRYADYFKGGWNNYHANKLD